MQGGVDAIGLFTAAGKENEDLPPKPKRQRQSRAKKVSAIPDFWLLYISNACDLVRIGFPVVRRD